MQEINAEYALTERGLKVWFDKVGLSPGTLWEDRYFLGLMDCRSFICLLSRNGQNNKSDDRCNFSGLTGYSLCDDVLLQYRSALELIALGYIKFIFPIFIGDYNETDDSFTNYFSDGCAPTCPSVHVQSVEDKLGECFDSVGLGSPMYRNVTVKEVFDMIAKYMGCFYYLDRFKSFEQAIESIMSVSLITPQEYDFEFFISYRITSEGVFADKLYNFLIQQGYKVFIDKACLKVGKRWTDAYIEGLAHSKCFLALISRRSIYNLTVIDEDSTKDNILVEYRLALEHLERKALSYVVPILIGDFNEEERTYTNIFRSGVFSQEFPNITVESLTLEYLKLLGIKCYFQISYNNC